MSRIRFISVRDHINKSLTNKQPHIHKKHTIVVIQCNSGIKEFVSKRKNIKQICATNQLILSTCLVIHGRCLASGICIHCIHLASFITTYVAFTNKGAATSTSSMLRRILVAAFMDSYSSVAGVIDFLDSIKDFTISVNDSMNYDT